MYYCEFGIFGVRWYIWCVQRVRYFGVFSGIIKLKNLMEVFEVTHSKKRMRIFLGQDNKKRLFFGHLFFAIPFFDQVKNNNATF